MSDEIEMKGWIKIFVRPHIIKTIKNTSCHFYLLCVHKLSQQKEYNCFYEYVCRYMIVGMYVGPTVLLRCKVWIGVSHYQVSPQTGTLCNFGKP